MIILLLIIDNSKSITNGLAHSYFNFQSISSKFRYIFDCLWAKHVFNFFSLINIIKIIITFFFFETGKTEKKKRKWKKKDKKRGPFQNQVRKRTESTESPRRNFPFPLISSSFLFYFNFLF